MGWYALHPLNHDSLIWFCISPWWANIPEIKISCGASIKNSLLTWEMGTPVLPPWSWKRRRNPCMHGIRQGDTRASKDTLYRNSTRTLRQIHHTLWRNIESFPPKLGFSHQPCPLCSVLDNIHKCCPGFIMHFCRCNLHIFFHYGVCNNSSLWWRRSKCIFPSYASFMI